MKLNDILTKPTDGLSDAQKASKTKSEALFKKAAAFTADLKSPPKHFQGSDKQPPKD